MEIRRLVTFCGTAIKYTAPERRVGSSASPSVAPQEFAGAPMGWQTIGGNQGSELRKKTRYGFYEDAGRVFRGVHEFSRVLQVAC